jgi:hypothetical protein
MNMMLEITTEKKLTPGQRKAIESLLTTGTVAAAALNANVNRGTIYRWMADEFFVHELRQAEREAVEGLSRALAGLGDLAASALRDALDSRQKITVRLRAAEIVTDRLLKIRELVDLEARLAELEQRV